MEAQLDESSELLEKEIATNNRLDAKLTRLDMQLRSASEQLDAVSEDKELAQARAKVLEVQLDAAVAEGREARDDRGILVISVAEGREALDDRETRIAELEQQLSECRISREDDGNHRTNTDKNSETDDARLLLWQERMRQLEGLLEEAVEAQRQSQEKAELVESQLKAVLADRTCSEVKAKQLF